MRSRLATQASPSPGPSASTRRPQLRPRRHNHMARLLIARTTVRPQRGHAGSPAAAVLRSREMKHRTGPVAGTDRPPSPSGTLLLAESPAGKEGVMFARAHDLGSRRLIFSERKVACVAIFSRSRSDRIFSTSTPTARPFAIATTIKSPE